MPNTPVTHGEVRSLLWAAFKWVAFTGLALAFAAGVWATDLRADVNKALGLYPTVVDTKIGVDSLRIEMRHMSEQLDRIERNQARK